MERRAITLRGIVQGVGLRPFSVRLASRLGLGGFVRNQRGSLLVEVEGETPALERFLALLAAGPPPLAQIDQLHWERLDPRGDRCFAIAPSDPGAGGSDP